MPIDESDESTDAVPDRRVVCVRCECDKTYLGTKRLREGAQWGILGDLGRVFVNREKFDVYACPKCGGVEFFVDGVGEKFRPQ